MNLKKTKKLNQNSIFELNENDLQFQKHSYYFKIKEFIRIFFKKKSKHSY
jgi:hypothetical protein